MACPWRLRAPVAVRHRVLAAVGRTMPWPASESTSPPATHAQAGNGSRRCAPTLAWRDSIFGILRGHQNPFSMTPTSTGRQTHTRCALDPSIRGQWQLRIGSAVAQVAMPRSDVCLVDGSFTRVGARHRCVPKVARWSCCRWQRRSAECPGKAQNKRKFSLSNPRLRARRLRSQGKD